MNRRPMLERFLERIDKKPNGCWEYTGARNESGYGLISKGGRGGKNVRAHRFSYEHFVGPIPDGLVIDHLCRNPPCVNPSHLEPVTSGENIRRGVRKTRQTACKQGHPFTPENTKVTPRQRICLTCSRARMRDYMARRRQENAA